MTETLLHAYTPLIIWTGLGLLLFRFIPKALPQLLGRMLYWFGVPVEILALARRTSLGEGIGLATGVTVAALSLGLVLAYTSLQIVTRLAESDSRLNIGLQERSWQGSFILSALLGNTGFIGLAIAPLIVSDQALNLVVFYSITQNIIGTYGLGVYLASYFGRPSQANHWWVQIRDVFLVPSLWAFAIGYFTRNIELPSFVESGLQSSIWLVIPVAFLLMGIRLGQIQGWTSFQTAIVPALLKAVVMPGFVGLGTTLLNLPPASRLAFVLMSGMPTAFAGLILAEEYDLNRELIASSIVLTSVLLLLLIPLWVVLLS